MKHMLETLGANFGFQLVILMGGAFRHLKVALIADELTRFCLVFKWEACEVAPLNSKFLLWL
jgi:hypothetical protein